MTPKTKQRWAEFIIACGIAGVVLAAIVILAYFLIPRNMM